ncbi:MAG: DUF1963 domain-containing protein [Lewinellaceae bacterium]|nr:DUF1963 domain-containing protein [Phaeodactylibacter sp.]MCB9347661.1 DUF1963 domain-containing protein [Lewinellaceae bacterium]
MNTNITLPEELHPFRDLIFETLRPYIQLLPREPRELLPWESKIGGLPYLPADREYPTASDGSPLWLLAQVNFEEAPALSPFPTQGLLQFFIYDDAFYGLNLDNPFEQGRFRVLYHPVIQKAAADLQSDFSFLGEARFLPIEAGVSHPLEFKLGHELAPPSDYQFEALLGEGFFEVFGAEQWEVQSRYSRAALSSRHKIGGYAFFCQEDPRNLEEPMELLFQLGSSDQFNCMWGDMGVANFFICRDALQRADFSRVRYHWDCY